MKLHEILEEQAKLTPDLPALQFCNDKPISYSSLNKRANQLARCLKDKYDISKKNPVIMKIPRCADQVTILLALSKLGAIYVPLDITCPKGRIERIIADISPTAVIISNKNDFHLKNNGVIDLLKLARFLDQYDESNLNEKISDDDISYIIYTSGTTAAPKGVPIRYKGFSYWLKIIRERFKISPSRKVLGYISVSFDAHIWEYLMAWSGGAALHLLNDESRSNVHSLKKFIIDHRVTDATLNPTTLRSMKLENFLPHTYLKAIYSTGEACTAEIVKALENCRVKLWNCYGPTEATFGISVINCTTASLDKKGNAPIGNPENDVNVFILDDDLKPVLHGKEGQLYIESPYMTTHYWNRPEETKRHFKEVIIENKRRLLYATGDTFYRDNRFLRYCGRYNIDSHIKIRGQKVELLEVESLIRSIDGVEDTCVLAVERNDKKFLLGFVKADDPNLTDVEIRNFLLSHLIQAAIPAKFIKISKLPQTTNGKVDKEALMKKYKADRSKSIFLLAIEKELVALLQDILRINEINHKDTFYTLGGDSISLTKLYSRLEKKFEIKIELADFYQRDLTIAALSNLIHQKKWDKDRIKPILIKKGFSNQNIFLIHPITGDASTAYPLFAMKLFNKLKKINIYSIDARGLDNAIDISSDLQTIAMDYAKVIKVFSNHQPYIIIGWSFGGALSWKISEILESENRSVKLILLDTLHPQLYKESQDYFFHQLTNLMLNIKSIFNLDMDFINFNGEGDTQINQISNIFKKLIQRNSEKETLLTQIYALLIAYYNFRPERLVLTKVQLFVSEQTSKTLQEYIPQKTQDFYSTLGWSKSHYNISSHPVMCDHFQLINEESVIEEFLKMLFETNRKTAFIRSLAKFAKDKKNIYYDESEEEETSNSFNYSAQEKSYFLIDEPVTLKEHKTLLKKTQEILEKTQKTEEKVRKFESFLRNLQLTRKRKNIIFWEPPRKKKKEEDHVSMTFDH